MTPNRREYLTAKKREQRERARAHGLCGICAKNPSDAGMATCSDCRDGIKDWQARQRRGKA